MSLHDDVDSDSPFGCLFVLPPIIGIPLLIVLVLFVIGTCLYEDDMEPEWQAAAKAEVVTRAAKAYATDDVKLLQCRRDGGSIFHCDLSVGQGDQPRKVITADCDGAQPGRCEACND